MPNSLEISATSLTEALKNIQEGDFKQAIQSLKKKYKHVAEDTLWVQLGSIFGQKNLYDECAICCKNALRINPSNSKAHSYLGNIYLSRNDNKNAVKHYKYAVKLDSADYYNFGMALRHLGQYKDAAAALEASISLNSEHANCHYVLATTCINIGDEDKAVDHYKKALKLMPNMINAIVDLARYYKSKGDYEQSEKQYNLALSLDEDYVAAVAGLAELKMKTGDKIQAYVHVRKIIDSGRYSADILNVYATISKDLGDRTEAIRLSENLINKNFISKNEKSTLGYALGNMYDKKGDYDNAMHYYHLANKLAAGKFSNEILSRRVDEIIDIFSKKKFKSMSTAPVSNISPIFIVGMPRSGTSLTEQILSMHSKVYAAGESMVIPNTVREISKVYSNHPYYETLGFTPEKLKKYAEKYINNVVPTDDESKYITDKLPSNHYNIGFILQLFPNAKFVHCRRDPRDNCLSIYFQNFHVKQPFSNNFEHIAHYYNEQVRLMNYWRNHLNIEIYDVEYEAMVANSRLESTALLDFCGLDWEESCMEFYKSKRNVKTASYNQVNRPIYTESVARWKKYEAHIDDLLKHLEPSLLQ